jgi:Flp pilus assembly protein TadG
MRPFRPISTEPLGSSLRAWGRDRDGGVAVTVAVMTTVLVGLLALSIDLGRLYNSSTERENAADAAAIAAATQLDGSAGACARAIDAAIAADLANQETFASNRTGPNVYLSPVGSTADGSDPTTNPNIRFLSNLIKDDAGNVTGTYITGGAVNCDPGATFVEVTTDLVAANENVQVDYYFAGIVGAVTSAFPRGYAVAEYPTANCGLAPMMVCSLSNPGSDWMDEVASYQHTGKGLWLKAGENSTQWGPGNFGFLRIGGIQGANDLADAMGMVNPPFDCLGSDDFSTKPGANESVRKAFNTRFDMFHNMTSEQNDRQWQPSPNPVKGLLKTGPQCGITGNGYAYPSPEYDGPVNTPGYAGPAMPLPKDECAYGGVSPTCIPVPGIDPGRMGDGDWERDRYMAVNHPGFTLAGINLANWDISWPTVGTDGQLSRYEMYLWEMGRYHSDSTYGQAGVSEGPHLVDNTAAGGELGDLQCFNPLLMGNDADTTLLRDRRVMEVLVVDCANVPGGVKGNTDLNVERDVEGTLEVFLVEPWTVNGGGDHEIYTEIIGPGGDIDAALALTPVKKWINLKESRQTRP